MRQVTYNIDVEMFPGVMIDLPDIPKFGCSDASFKLTWDNPNIDLGFSLIGPSGEEVLSTREPGVPSSFESSTHDEGIPYPPGTTRRMPPWRALLHLCLCNEWHRDHH